MEWNFISITAAVLAVPLVFSFIIFIHEMGHFLVGRWCGVHAEVFSIGFGKELFGWDDKQGTHWRVALFPIGGYVRFMGDMDAASTPDFSNQAQLSEEDRNRTLMGQNVWKRIAIILAGPVVNIIFAWLVFTAFIYTSGTISGTLEVYSNSPEHPAIEKGSPAEKAGFEIHDQFVSVNGKAITKASDVKKALLFSPNDPVTFTMKRNGREVDLTVIPEPIVVQTDIGMQRDVRMGVVLSYIKESLVQEKFSLFDSSLLSVSQCWQVIEGSGRAIYLIFKGKLSLDTMSGGIRMAEAIGRVGGHLDFLWLLYITALFSLNIGILNLLPIPVLDGGHILFALIEALKGSPVNEKIQEFAFKIGLTIIILLTFLVLTMDTNFKMIYG